MMSAKKEGASAPQAPAKGQIRTAHGRRSPCGERTTSTASDLKGSKAQVGGFCGNRTDFRKSRQLSSWPSTGHVHFHSLQKRQKFRVLWPEGQSPHLNHARIEKQDRGRGCAAITTADASAVVPILPLDSVDHGVRINTDEARPKQAVGTNRPILETGWALPFLGPSAMLPHQPDGRPQQPGVTSSTELPAGSRK